MSDLKVGQELETMGFASSAPTGRAGPGRRPLLGWLRMAELFVLGIGLVGIGAVLLLRPWARRTYHVNILIDLDPNRALLAERIAREAQAHNLDVELSSEPHGSLDAIELVELPNGLDLALVPGGVVRRDYANVRQVTALSLEPLQLLTRADPVSAGVAGLKGRRVCLGPPTTCAHFLARNVLAFARLRPTAADRPGDYVADQSSPQELRLGCGDRRTSGQTSVGTFDLSVPKPSPSGGASMKTRKRLVLALGLAALLAAGGVVAVGRLRADADKSKAEDKGLDKERRAAFIAAYERGDAAAVAAFWAEDATYVDPDGIEHKGRPAIEKMYAKVFADNKGAKLAIHVTSLKQTTPDVALEDGITEVTPSGGGFPAAAQFSAVLVKKDGEWYLQSVHETDPQPPSNVEELDDIAWLVGDWAGENEKGESANASYDWAENNNFIVSTFTTTLDGFPVAGGTQWIGWDAVDKQIRSWSFYSGGGFGDAVWTRDGNKFSLKVTARTAAGKKVTATNVITKTDEDHLTWQVTKLNVDGESVPDLNPVKMKRVPPEQP